MFGLSVSIMTDCESDTCSYSRCIASDMALSNGMGGCKYRCYGYSVYNHILVDFTGLYGNNLTLTLSEIIF